MATIDQLVIRFRTMTPRARLAMVRQVTIEAGELVRVVQADYLSGQMVGQRTMRLRNSIHPQVTETPSGVLATVGTDVEYARYVHDGTAPHVILPRNAEALRFMMGGRTVFAKRVNHPGTKARPFLTAPLEARATGIRERITAAVEKEMRS